jgi:hypothetical protein
MNHPSNSSAGRFGGGSVLSAFSLLAQKRLSGGNEKAVCAGVSEIIFYEPPVNGVLNLQPSPSTITERAEAAQKNENPLETFLSRVAGLYDYPADFLEGIKAGVRDERVFKPTRTLADDADFRKGAEEIMDAGSMKIYVSSMPKDEEGKMFVRRSLKAMLEATGVRRIKVLSTPHTLPDCVEGC